MQAAVDAKVKEDAGETVEPPKPGSVDDTIAKWIAPVSFPSLAIFLFSRALTPNQPNREKKNQIKSLASPHAHAASDPLSTLELATLTDEHVRATVEAVAASDLVRAAWDEGRDLSVHGWVYHVATAKLRDLDCGFKGRESPPLSLSLSLPPSKVLEY